MVSLTKFNDDREAAQFADDLTSVLRDAGLKVNALDTKVSYPPEYGLKIWVDESTPRGHAFGMVLRKLPTADMHEYGMRPPLIATILVGLKQPV